MAKLNDSGKQAKLESALNDAIKIINTQQKIIKSLQHQLNNFSMYSYLAYEDVFENNGTLASFPELEVNARDIDFDVNCKLKLFAEHIVLIASLDKKNRKIIYTYNATKKPNVQFGRFVIHDQKLPFPTLLNKLDPLSRILLRVSKEEIINVTYFDELSKNTIKAIIEHPGMQEKKCIEVSYKDGMANFRKLKSTYRYNVLSHKKLFRHKKALEEKLDGKFDKLKKQITMKIKKETARKSPKGNGCATNPNYPSTNPGVGSGKGRGNTPKPKST